MQMEYLRFIVVLSFICLSRARYTRNSGDPGTILVRSVFDPLMTTEAVEAIGDAELPGDDWTISALKAELAYFVACHPLPEEFPERRFWPDMGFEPRFQTVYGYFREYRDSIVDAYNAESTAKALEEASTIKESIEELLEGKLPDWIKRMLKVLNELLNIV